MTEGEAKYFTMGAVGRVVPTFMVDGDCINSTHVVGIFLFNSTPKAVAIKLNGSADLQVKYTTSAQARQGRDRLVKSWRRSLGYTDEQEA
jgi:hypothetical protein